MDETVPGHYGVNDWEAETSPATIYTNVPKRSFTFKDVDFSFDLKLGESGKDGIDQSVRKTASGYGTFEFLNNKKVTITDLVIEIDLSLWE